MLDLTDTHAHLNDARFESDLDDAVERALAAGVSRIVCVGMDLATSRRAIDVSRAADGIRAAVGIQPNYSSEAGQGDWEEIASLARHPRVVGIGETGLDYHYDWSPPEVQRALFEKHVALAATLRKPLIVHSRRAADDVLAILKAGGSGVRAVQHCFSDDVACARRILDLGCFISFTGIITRTGYRQIKQAATFVPADRLLIETDCPYMLPLGESGEAPPVPATAGEDRVRNEPAFLPLVLSALARLRGEDPERLAADTTRNAIELFGLP